MGIACKKEYDAHLLYHAINITAELKYKLPMDKIYDFLEKSNNNQKNIDTQSIINVLSKLGNNLQSNAENNNTSTNCDTLQSKIKELLKLLNCDLSNDELNQILKGDIPIDQLLNKDAQTVWKLIFYKNEKKQYRPKEIVTNYLLSFTQIIALENIEEELQIAMENKKIQLQRSDKEWLLNKNDNIKTVNREKYINPQILEDKRNKLRLYIAHMQGYDIDRDRDGGMGIDPTTGYVIDFGDIYISDKMHGSFIQNREDGIDIEEIH